MGFVHPWCGSTNPGPETSTLSTAASCWPFPRRSPFWHMGRFPCSSDAGQRWSCLLGDDKWPPVPGQITLWRHWVLCVGLHIGHVMDSIVCTVCAAYSVYIVYVVHTEVWAFYECCVLVWYWHRFNSIIILYILYWLLWWGCWMYPIVHIIYIILYALHCMYHACCMYIKTCNLPYPSFLWNIPLSPFPSKTVCTFCVCVHVREFVHTCVLAHLCV